VYATFLQTVFPHNPLRINIPACYLCSEPTMGQFALGKLTGVIVHSGFGTTTISCLYEGTFFVRFVELSFAYARYRR
jgi:hypothetical protein